MSNDLRINIGPKIFRKEEKEEEEAVARNNNKNNGEKKKKKIKKQYRKRESCERSEKRGERGKCCASVFRPFLVIIRVL